VQGLPLDNDKSQNNEKKYKWKTYKIKISTYTMNSWLNDDIYIELVIKCKMRKPRIINYTFMTRWGLQV